MGWLGDLSLVTLLSSSQPSCVIAKPWPMNHVVSPFDGLYECNMSKNLLAELEYSVLGCPYMELIKWTRPTGSK